ncbi:MAG TPA: 5-(carboxyamino)imidazole ribonucleotide mutase [Candidatus Paceibacterota bacterium]
MEKPLVGILMGSDSDLAIMSEAAKVCEQFNVSFEISVISAHRTPDRAAEYAKTAEERGLKVIIAGAGVAAHLGGVIAAMTPLPVIGVPLNASLDGLDSLLSIAQMPPGIPVACVAINGAKNAGLLAMRILALSDEKIRDGLKKHTETMKEEVNKKSTKLHELGYKKYLEEQDKK